MESILKKLILEGKYSEAEGIITQMNFSEQRDEILNLAYDSESVAVYSFLRYVTEKNKKQFWLELTIDVLINPLCFIEGAYSIALFHARELLDMNLSIKNMERILFFYNIPEKIVDYTEAVLIAKKILEIEPNNEVAQEILKKS